MDQKTAIARFNRLLMDAGDLSPMIVTDPNTGRSTVDSNVGAVMYRQLQYVEREIYKVEYPDLLARSILPVDHNVPSGAASFMYRMFDRVGEAALVTDWSKDFPNVEILGEEFPASIYHFGDSFSYSSQDLREASMAGLPLETEKAEAAREAIEQKLEGIAAVGLAGTSLKGLANNPNVPTLAATPNGNWTDPATTGEDIANDVLLIWTQVFINSPKNTEIDTLLVTPEQLAAMKKPMNQYDRRSAEQYVKETTSIKSIVKWNRLRTAGAGGVPRIVGMRKDPKVAKLVIPQEFEMSPVFVKHFTYSTACHLSTGGVVIRQPLEMIYADNLA